MNATTHQYGNSSIQTMSWIKKSSFLDRYFTDLTQMQPPAAHDEIIQQQLTELVTMVAGLDEATERRYKMYDRGLQSYVVGFKFENDDAANELYKELITELFNDVLPLIYKIKLHYQQPRPVQLAAMYKIGLYPHASLSAQCPSYPSMHACMGFVLKEVIGNRFTEAYKYFSDMQEDVCYSRLYLGLCLPADIEAGKAVAKKIVLDREFQIKYKL